MCIRQAATSSSGTRKAVASGMYWVELTAGSERFSQKLILSQNNHITIRQPALHYIVDPSRIKEDTMKRLILLLPVLSQPAICSAHSGKWGLYSVLGRRENEYQVVGSLSVPNGRALILEEGVRVKFVGAFSLSVSGEIVCNGTAENPIVFTCDTIQVPSRWKGIRVNTAEGAFYHTIVEHADYDQIGEEAAKWC